MTSTSPATHDPVAHGVSDRSRSRRDVVTVAVFLCWTLFVWVGRIRNVSADTTVTSGERSATVALALSFVLPAILIAIAMAISRGRRSAAAGSVVRFGVYALAAWTTGVWVVRGVAISFDGRGAAFIAVHLVLATLSILAAVLAVRAVRRRATAGTSRTAQP